MHSALHGPPLKMNTEQSILKEMEKQNISFKQFAADLDVSRFHLTSCLKGEGNKKRDLSQQLLDKINAVLGTDFKKQ